MCAIPENRADNVALLVEKLKISRQEAERTYELLLDPGFGFTPDARFDPRASRTCWRCGPRSAPPGDQAADPSAIIDLGYYERAMKLLVPERRDPSAVRP